MSFRHRTLRDAVLAVLIVCVSVVPALGQDPSLTPAGLLPGDQAPVAAAGDQWISDIAPGDGQLLAVWQDERTDLRGDLLPDQSAKDIWAARYDALGQRIDVLPFPVTQGAGDQKAPKAAWNGSNWLVAWQAQVPTQFFYTEGIEVARVAPDGTVLDAPLQITTASNDGNMELWAVASDGDGWAVFWKDFGGPNWQLRAVRIAPDGTQIDVTPKNLGATSSQPYDGDVVFAIDEYLVVWKEWVSSQKDNIRARRIAPGLTSIGPAFTVASHFYYETRPAVATDGNDFFVVWERYDTCCVGGGGKVFGSRVLHDGTVLDGPDGLPIYAPPNLYGTTGRGPAVAWDGTNWVASFTKPGLLINAARVTPAGVTLDPDGFDVDPMSPRQEGSAITGLPGGGSLILWTDSRAEGVQRYDTFGALLSTGGVPTPLGVEVLAAPAQTSVELVSVPGGALALWTSKASGARRVLVQPVDTAGLALIPEPIEVATGFDVGNVNAAWNGSVVLATWDSGLGVQARRLDSGGNPLDPSPIAIMPGYGSDVASLDDTFFVTALNAPSNPEIVNVFSRRVTGEGVLIDASPVYIGSSHARSQTSVAFDGGYLVAWQRNFSHDDNNSALHMRFVSADNVPGPEMVLANGITDGGHNEQPTIAVDDLGQALLAWEVRNGGDDWNIVARRVQPGLTLPDTSSIPITSAVSEQLLPSVAWSGTEYVVTWQDRRSATFFWDDRTDVFAARVGSNGSVIDPDGFPLAASALPEIAPAVTALGGGEVLFAWSAFHDEPPFTAYRVETSLMQGEGDAWTDLGQGLAGTNGVPGLAGQGSLLPGTLTTLTLVDALESAPSILILGFSELGAPFKGGVIVPALDVVIFGLLTDPVGGMTIAMTWPSGLPSGLGTWWQLWIVDAGGPFGFAASNGLLGTTP